VVAEVLWRGLAEPKGVGELPPLPTHHMGRPTVDLADGDALYRAMESA
jgi:hypothetical protein